MGSACCIPACAADQICRARTCESRLTEFTVNKPLTISPYGLAWGPDGNIWFTALEGFIGRLTPAGDVRQFDLLPFSQPLAITTGPDKNLWFTEFFASEVGRIGLDGMLLPLIPLPGIPADGTGAGPMTILTGPDGNVWTVEYHTGWIARMTPAGAVTSYTADVPSANLYSVTVAPDGDLWFTEAGLDRIGHISVGGVLGQMIDTGHGTQPRGITVGPDGNLWFAAGGSGEIGRITKPGIVTRFPAGSRNALYPTSITAGSDGNLWFTYYASASASPTIGRMTLQGQLTEFLLPHTASQPSPTLGQIITGADGNLWFSEPGAGLIGRFDPR